MANRPHSVSVNTQANVNEAGNNTETVLATLVGVTPEFPGQPVKLFLTCRFTLGTTGTGCTFRFRRAALGGTLVGNAKNITSGLTAGAIAAVAVQEEDNPGEGLFIYVATFQGAAETAVGSVQDSELRAEWA